MIVEGKLILVLTEGVSAMKKSANQIGVGINLVRSDDLRAKLMAEISEYERQQAALKLNGTHVNFTMIQTYKELIAARRSVLKQLPAIY
jgi:biotin-(acetyl-CoA carboxylase) ligase